MRRFHEAAIFAADQIEDVVIDGRLDFAPSTFAQSVASWSKQVQTIPDKHGSHFEITEPFAVQIVRLSKEHAEFYDLAVEICSTNIFGGFGLPDALQVFTYSVLKGSLKRPTPAHRERSRNWLEKAFLHNLTREIAEKFDLTTTNNDDASSALSACEAITQALNICGRRTKYSEIKNLMVHPNHARFRQELDVAYSIWHRGQLERIPKNALSLSYSVELQTNADAIVMDINRALFPLREKAQK